jgi:hypothetical protein
MMTDKLIADILMRHADALQEGDDEAEVYLAMSPEQRAELLPLLQLARELDQLLAPVDAPDLFRAGLRAALLDAAAEPAATLDRPWWAIRPRLQERLSDLPVLIRLPEAPERQVLVRAAAGGAGLAAAGVAAYMLHGRFFAAETPPNPTAAAEQ